MNQPQSIPPPPPTSAPTTTSSGVPKDNQESGEDLLTTTKPEQDKTQPSASFVRPPQKQATTTTTLVAIVSDPHQPEEPYVIQSPPPLSLNQEEEEEEEACPVLYARACGALDAWLILLQGTDHPCIVVPKDSPATDFLVRLVMIRDTPPYARSDPRGHEKVCSVSIELDPDPASWQLIRADILEARQIRFDLLNYDTYPYSGSDDDDDDDGPEGPRFHSDRNLWSDDYYYYHYNRHGDLSEAFMEASQEERHYAMQAMMSSPMMSPPDLDSRMIEAMGDESVWMVPMLQAEMLGRKCMQEEADRNAGISLLPLTASYPELLPSASSSSSDDDDDDDEEAGSFRPRFSAGLRIVTAIPPSDTPENALDALVGHSSSGGMEEPYSPMQSHEASRRQLHHEMAQVWNNIMTAIGWRRGPQKAFADALSPPPQPWPEEGTEPNTEVSLPAADQTSSHSDADTVIVLQEINTDVESAPLVPTAATPAPPRRKVHVIEQALMDTTWCRLSISEFMAWRCEAQSPLVDSLLIRNLAATEKLNGDGDDWVLQALGNSSKAKSDLWAAVKKRTPALVALGDAQERLFAAVKDVCQRGKCTENRQVILDLEIWEALTAAAGVSWEAHQRCFNRPPVPPTEVTVQWVGGTTTTGGITTTTGGITKITTIQKEKEKETGTVDEQ